MYDDNENLLWENFDYNASINLEGEPWLVMFSEDFRESNMFVIMPSFTCFNSDPADLSKSTSNAHVWMFLHHEYDRIVEMLRSV